MKKYIVTMVLLAMGAGVGGYATNAEATSEITFPKLSATTEETESPYQYEIETESVLMDKPEVVEREATAIAPGGESWIYAKTQDGTQGYKTTQYKKTYNQKGELLSRVEIPDSTTIVDATPTVYEGGQAVQPGAYYRASRITRYGVDCHGCNMGADGRGPTASGVGLGLDEVRQADGTWRKGLTYEGYYVVAASPTFPLYTILEIKNHTLSGAGIQPGVPFQAIVLDRGGAIQGSKLDLFVGSETNMLIGSGSMQQADIEIIR